MDRAEAFKVFVDAVVDVLARDPEEVVLTAAFKEDFDIDSLGVVELVLALEESFDIDIPEDDADGVTTVGEAFELVCRTLGLSLSPTDS